MKNENIKSYKTIKKSKQPLANVNVKHFESLSKIDQVAVWITEHIGSMGFFILIFVWTVSWLSWNMLAPVRLRFDPFPAFVLWLFISNMIQIFLMPLIMIGQNLQSKHAEVRADEDFEINKKAELEIETILMHLENQNEWILEILQKMSIDKAKNQAS